MALRWRKSLLNCDQLLEIGYSVIMMDEAVSPIAGMEMSFPVGEINFPRDIASSVRTSSNAMCHTDCSLHSRRYNKREQPSVANGNWFHQESWNEAKACAKHYKKKLSG